MSEHDGGQPVVVNVGACRCPGGAHDPGGDTVSLAPRLTLPMAVAAHGVLRNGGNVFEVQGRFAAVWLHLGIVDWTFIDEKGAPIPFTEQNLERLVPWAEGGYELADRADDLYAGDFFRPLAPKTPKRSPTSSTDGRTSPTKATGHTHPKRSKRSSPAATAGTPSEDPVP